MDIGGSLLATNSVSRLNSRVTLPRDVVEVLGCGRWRSAWKWLYTVPTFVNCLLLCVRTRMSGRASFRAPQEADKRVLRRLQPVDSQRLTVGTCSSADLQGRSAKQRFVDNAYHRKLKKGGENGISTAVLTLYWPDTGRPLDVSTSSLGQLVRCHYPIHSASCDAIMLLSFTSDRHHPADDRPLSPRQCCGSLSALPFGRGSKYRCTYHKSSNHVEAALPSSPAVASSPSLSSLKSSTSPAW